MATERDTRTASDLIRQAVDIVEATANADPWILEIRRARECRLINVAKAEFLIERFARSAVMPLTVRHPVLAGLMLRLTEIEREYGLDKGDHWEDNDGPPEYQALCDECKAAMRRLATDILVRNGERRIAKFLANDGEDEFWFSHALLFRMRQSKSARRISRHRVGGTSGAADSGRDVPMDRRPRAAGLVPAADLLKGH